MWWASRRFISGVIHSRACWVEEYRVAGRRPSRVWLARRVILMAMMSWPFTDWPIVTNLTMSGLSAASCSNSSLRPPAPAYGRKTS